MIEPNFDAPIAGMGMTKELGSRPWQSPPQNSTVEDAIEYYIPKLSEEVFSDSLLDVLELGVPITTIANTLQMGGVMEGIHSVDVGILVIPVLMESIVYLAEEAGVNYKLGTDSLKDSDTVSQSKIALAFKNAKGESDDTQDMLDSNEAPMVEDMPEPEVQEEAVVEEPPAPMGGLMGRRM